MSCKLWLWSTGVAALAVPHGGYAQDSTHTVEEIVVTAQKRSENIQAVPISISAVSAESIQRAGIASLEGVQRLAPGMTMSTIGSGFVSYTYIRGAGTNVLDSGSDPSVAFFVDEVYLAGTAGLQFDLLDLERVEVLKGPQGTLFGRNAAAGAIHIITKRPEETFNAFASAEAGNYGQVSARGSVTGPITADGDWRYRLSAGHRERDAFTSNPAGLDPGFIDTYNARGQLEYVGDTFDARLSAEYFTADNGMTNQFLATANKAGFLSPAAIAALPTDENFYRRYYSVNGFERQDTYGITARLEWTLPFATLTSISAYRDNNFRRMQDQDGTGANALTFGTKQQDRTFSQELRLSNDGERLHWIAGLYFYDGRTDRFDTFHPGPEYAFAVLVGLDGSYSHRIDTRSYAAFGQLTYDLTEKLSATLGARYTQDEKESNQHVDPFGPVGLFDVHLTPAWNSFDPSFTLQYQANPGLMVYASARKGFKSGGFQSLPTSPALAATVYDPEHVQAYELGMKSRWLDDRLQANVAIFRAEMKDQQILRVPTAATSIIDNAGETKTDGIDLSLSARIARRLSIELGATYQEARFEKYTSAGVSFADNSQLRSPDFAGSFVAEYGQPLGGVGELRLRGEYSYQTKIFFDAANTELPNTYQPDYGLVNARMTYAPASGGWELSIFGKNLADEEYFRNIAVVGPSAVGTPGDPRTYGAQVSWHLH